MTSSELCKRYGISKPTLSRMIQSGLPYSSDPGHSQRFIFDPDRVSAWMDSHARREAGRPIEKTYWIFQNGGGLLKTVNGSRAARAALKAEYSTPGFMPFCKDAAGRVYVNYGGKLRLYRRDLGGIAICDETRDYIDALL